MEFGNATNENLPLRAMLPGFGGVVIALTRINYRR